MNWNVALVRFAFTPALVAVAILAGAQGRFLLMTAAAVMLVLAHIFVELYRRSL